MIEYSKTETLRIRFEDGDSLLDVVQCLVHQIGDGDLEDSLEGFIFVELEVDGASIFTREGKMEKMG